MSQSSSSLCKWNTSSTEVFVAATRATLSSNRRVSERGLGAPSTCMNRSALLANASVGNSCAASYTGRRRGVLRPLKVKSSRMSRTESYVNCSRQKGQTGMRREDVFSTMVEQQGAHRICPIQNFNATGVCTKGGGHTTRDAMRRAM